MEKIDQTFNSPTTTRNAPSQWSCRVYIMRFWRKTTALYETQSYKQYDRYHAWCSISDTTQSRKCPCFLANIYIYISWRIHLVKTHHKKFKMGKRSHDRWVCLLSYRVGTSDQSMIIWTRRRLTCGLEVQFANCFAGLEHSPSMCLFVCINHVTTINYLLY